MSHMVSSLLVFSGMMMLVMVNTRPAASPGCPDGMVRIRQGVCTRLVRGKRVAIDVSIEGKVKSNDYMNDVEDGWFKCSDMNFDCYESDEVICPSNSPSTAAAE